MLEQQNEKKGDAQIKVLGPPYSPINKEVDASWPVFGCQHIHGANLLDFCKNINKSMKNMLLMRTAAPTQGQHPKIVYPL